MVEMEERDVPTIPGEPLGQEMTRFLKGVVSTITRVPPTTFPGSQPVSFQRVHLEDNLMNKDYYVCEKSDGLRCLLLTLLHPETGDEGTFLITRANEYFMVPNFHFPLSPNDFSKPHNGTIVDGELVLSRTPEGTKQLRYLIFDCLAYNGESVMNKLTPKRLYYASELFYKPYRKLREKHPVDCQNFPFKLYFKDMTEPFKISKIFQQLHNLSYVSDGLILTCSETPYVVGTDSTLLKWKPAEENTIDFKLLLEFPKYEDEDVPEGPDRVYPDYDSKPTIYLYEWVGGQSAVNSTDPEKYEADFSKHQEFGQLTLTDEEWQELKESGERFNGRIAEVNQDKSKHWRLLRFRDDKLNANHYTVVGKVIQSIRDGVTKEELIQAQEQIRKNWEIRQRRRKEMAAGAAANGGQTSHRSAPAPVKPPTQQRPQPVPQQKPTTELKRPLEDQESSDDALDEFPTYDRSPSPDYSRKKVKGE
ncbi:Dcp1p-Dcp2p decapping enzyme complex alpha subunit [Komagataella phaffii CBS 7435]|uniref:mRNA-capping enzyme subunit alpha n=2 Tax=Komagataella phaffii TaxID=460519 RepID=C4R002_KOMPG|nr:Alpha (guanylyltransferase) subunit of the mRNA capping enzyme, a heterodimer (the other subunit is [Komagataella phaffii GS115]AOA61905.1 GQ67_00246T0 [Komagataella phaffii]CAH2448673.1 mRNA guanylyltransferase [Komagataella phaffii CBS 7435]AOA67722.1 GQ68_01142T0 [Komagataella phaffii GS115]CAY68826.1 Alpha (guanylyltransferase) subunit of the mRNA capping enzyme, a heterodimer (the other subunit is [Komagataella phaffii GS115]CCA38766.1 Dcp1p-Dcp2p decapping enzyme complex alpha subunit